jgi:hypothetical protein
MSLTFALFKEMFFPHIMVLLLEFEFFIATDKIITAFGTYTNYAASHLSSRSSTGTHIEMFLPVWSE